MAYLASPIARLIEELNRLPGVGPKTAQRLTYYLLRAPREEVDSLAQAIRELREKVVYCSTCFNIGDQDPCTICRDEARDRSLLCVVERPLDVLALEKTGDFGKYEKVDLDTVKFTLELGGKSKQEFTYVLTTRHGTRTE